MLQLDCRGASDYKTYGIPVTADFLSFIERETGYVRAESTGKTDIGRLCRDICRVNLSVGYYNERHPEETLVVAERERALSISRRRGWGRGPSCFASARVTARRLCRCRCSVLLTSF